MLIDPLPVNLILENALSNAVKHGHPQDPCVNLSLKLDRLLPTDQGPRPPRLVCTITNRIHPDRPRVTQHFVTHKLHDPKNRCGLLRRLGPVLGDANGREGFR